MTASSTNLFRIVARRRRAAGQDTSCCGPAPTPRSAALLPSRSLAILRYHAICGPEGYGYADPQICITPETSSGTSRTCRASLRDRAARRRRDAGSPPARPLPRNAVAITFDDGYADNLRRRASWRSYGATATFYITAGCLAGGEPFWPAEIRHLVDGRPGAAASGSRPAGVALDLPLDTDATRGAAVKALTKAFKSNLDPGPRGAARAAAPAGRRPADAARHADVGRGARDAPARHDDRLAHDDAPEPAERRARRRRAPS